jgi:hypothetical protein
MNVDMSEMVYEETASELEALDCRELIQVLVGCNSLGMGVALSLIVEVTLPLDDKVSVS